MAPRLHYNRAAARHACLEVIRQSGAAGIALIDVVSAASMTLGLPPTDATEHRLGVFLHELALEGQITKQRCGKQVLLRVVSTPTPSTTVQLQDVASTLHALAKACSSMGLVAERVQQTCTEGLDMAWRETMELLLRDCIERLERLEQRLETRQELRRQFVASVKESIAYDQ